MAIMESRLGESIYIAIQRAIACCNQTGSQCDLKHNDMLVRVYPGSHEYDIYEKWDLQCKLKSRADWK